MLSHATLPFPLETASARQERAFDRIVSVGMVGRLPVQRLRVRTVPGGIDSRWLANAVIIVHAVGFEPVAGKITQWRDDDPCDFVATLGMEYPIANAALRAHVPPEGHVAIVSGDRSRAYPLSAP